LVRGVGVTAAILAENGLEVVSELGDPVLMNRVQPDK
jgi:hypothetical protein